VVRIPAYIFLFSNLSTQELKPAQSATGRHKDMMLTSRVRLVQRLRMSKAVPLLLTCLHGMERETLQFLLYSPTPSPLPNQLNLHHSTYSKPSPTHSLGQSPCLLYPFQISVTSIPLNLCTCTKLHGVTSHRPYVYGGTPFSDSFINQNRSKFHMRLAALLSIFYPFIPQSVLRQVPSPFHSKFTTQCHLLFPLNFQNPLLSLRSPNSCLHLLPHITVTYVLLFCLSFNNVFQKAVPTQHVTHPDSPPSLYCK